MYASVIRECIKCLPQLERLDLRLFHIVTSRRLKRKDKPSRRCVLAQQRTQVLEALLGTSVWLQQERNQTRTRFICQDQGIVACNVT